MKRVSDNREPTMPSAVHGQSPFKSRVKGTLGTKMTLALWRKRAIPARAMRAGLLARKDRRAFPLPPEDTRRSFKSVYVVPVGPGSSAALVDTIDSIRHYEGDEAKIVVAEDGTTDCRRAVVRRVFPDVSVVRPLWPTGGPPRQSHFLCWVYAWALSRYRFDVLLKLDDDALVTGSSPSASACAQFAADRSLGMLGTYLVRADGVPEDYTYDSWVLEHEARWSSSIRRLVGAARAGGFIGAKVHGGVYALSRSALVDAHATGHLGFKPPWWSLMTEDTALSLIVSAAGYRLGSWGAPREPTVSGQGFLPIDKEAVVGAEKVAVHSVRRSLSGESEEELRAFFRARRLSA